MFTGMVRRIMVRKIDDLGRVVIPKEFRRILNIKAGDSLELDMDIAHGTLIIKKGDE